MNSQTMIKIVSTRDIIISWTDQETILHKCNISFAILSISNKILSLSLFPSFLDTFHVILFVSNMIHVWIHTKYEYQIHFWVEITYFQDIHENF